MKSNVLRFLIAVILASIIREFLHTTIGIPAPSYSKFINIMAYVTSPLGSALGIAITYYFFGDRLPTNSSFLKGIMLGMLVLLIDGQLIRQPLMNLLLSNTLREVFLVQLQLDLSTLAMTVTIALILKPKYGMRSARPTTGP
jgi:hypothetical protein